MLKVTKINKSNRKEFKMKEELTFEQAMQKLESIANELENDNLDLDTSVKQFEEGMKLSQKCNKILEEAEKKITILVNGEEKDFDVNKAEQQKG